MTTVRLAPDWLPRRQRRAVERRLQELWRRDACSICKRALAHTDLITTGVDPHANVVLVGECCAGLIAETFGRGLVIDREYDFLHSRLPSPPDAPRTPITAEALDTFRKFIADADRRIAGAARRSGGGPVGSINLLDRPLKRDDRAWFERNPSRAHRIRLPFPGEAAEAGETDAHAGHVMIMVIAQIERGIRRRGVYHIHAGLMPLPDDEAVAHALFEVTVDREPIPRDPQAFRALVEKSRMPPAARH